MKTAPRSRRVFDPQAKIKAVLSIWTERRSVSQVCTDLSISWALLDRWQNQAMEGMLEALSPKRPEAQPEALNLRLERLIEKNIQGRSGKLLKLEQRLKTIQKERKEKAETQRT